MTRWHHGKHQHLDDLAGEAGFRPTARTCFVPSRSAVSGASRLVSPLDHLSVHAQGLDHLGIYDFPSSIKRLAPGTSRIASRVSA